MSEQNMQEDRSGTTDHPQHRAGHEEGFGADNPDAGETGPIESSMFDGKGNEMVVVTTTDEKGRIVQGTGDDPEEALKDAKKGDNMIGRGFEPH